MELNYWITTFTTLATQSALLVGFSFYGLNAISETSGKQLIISTCFLVATATSMGFGLLCVTTCSLVLMLAPGKALRSNSLEGIESTIV